MGHLFVVCCDRVRQISLGNVVWSVMYFFLSMILYSNLFTSSRYVFRPKEEIDSFFLTHTGGALTNAGIGNLMTKEYRETSMQWPSGGPQRYCFLHRLWRSLFNMIDYYIDILYLI